MSDQNSTGCFFGDCASQPEICLEVETWVNTHEGRAPIIDFRTSTCVCEGNECNHVIPPDSKFRQNIVKAKTSLYVRQCV